MKFSQIQDVEYLLNIYRPGKKLVVKFDNQLVAANFIKTNPQGFPVQVKTTKYHSMFCNDDSFDGLGESLEESIACAAPKQKIPEWMQNDQLLLIKLIDFANRRPTRESDNILYNVRFFDSEMTMQFYLANPETDFQIVGLAD